MNTTIVIPIHQLTNKSIEFTKRAIESLNSQKDKNFKVLLVVGKSVDASSLNNFDGSYEYKFLVNDGDTDYQSQVNFAANNIDTDFFSILQYDDILFNNYVMNVNQHISSYDYDAYLGIVFEKDTEKHFLGFSNEALWSINHAAKFGEFDLKTAKSNRFLIYNTAGMTIKKEVFLKSGGFKKSMLRFHDYEFLLRILNTAKKVYVIPKWIYEHVNGHEDSISAAYKNMSVMEANFWNDTAKKEYYFDYDREVKFTE